MFPPFKRTDKPSFLYLHFGSRGRRLCHLPPLSFPPAFSPLFSLLFSVRFNLPPHHPQPPPSTSHSSLFFPFPHALSFHTQPCCSWALLPVPVFAFYEEMISFGQLHTPSSFLSSPENVSPLTPLILLLQITGQWGWSLFFWWFAALLRVRFAPQLAPGCRPLSWPEKPSFTVLAVFSLSLPRQRR